MDNQDRPYPIPRGPHHRRRQRQKDVGYSSSEGDNQSGYQSDENLDMVPRQNGLGLTSDESAISPIENLDNTISRLYSYLSGSEGDLEKPQGERKVMRCRPKKHDQGTSPPSSGGSHSRCSSATESDCEQPVHHCSTLESRVTGENVYSRISDSATLPIPPIPPPPPLEAMGPAVPPRRGEMIPFMPPYHMADPYSVSTIPQTAQSEIYGGAESEFEPQFLVQTASGTVFVPPVQNDHFRMRMSVCGVSVGHYSPTGSTGPPLVQQVGMHRALVPNSTLPPQWVGIPNMEMPVRRVATLPEQAPPPSVPNRATVAPSASFGNRQKQQPAAEHTPPPPPFRPVTTTPDVRIPAREKKDKERRCTWKCIGLIFIILCVFLAAGCAFAVVSMYNLSKKLDMLPKGNVYTGPDNSSQQASSLSPSPSRPVVLREHPLGKYSQQKIAPQGMWRTQVPIKSSQHVKFNFSVPNYATIGVYGRRHTQPTFTQYDFFQPIDTDKIPTRYRRAFQMYDSPVKATAFVQYMERGPWFVFVYNDADTPAQVGYVASPYEGTVKGCKDGCHGHGDCVKGRCECYPGYTGPECNQNQCPILCNGHGQYRRGECHCYQGWGGQDCRVPDSAQCKVRDCSGHGQCVDSRCICDHGFTGEHCDEEICPVTCVHGICRNQQCVCDKGWTGSVCTQLVCDSRCGVHGVCNNGTCACQRGWNGKHCTLDGCPNSCNKHGACVQFASEWRCSCHDGWKGEFCQVAIEMQCDDKTDNDQDGMIDCLDPDCCLSATCNNAYQCGTSPDPMEILLRKQPPSNTASFYDRMRFLVEEESVQNYARLLSFNSSQVSVIRGKLEAADGSPLLGVRVSVYTQPLYGFTVTRESGLFDLLVNGGGSVTLQFQRQPFQLKKTTIMVPWNRMVTMPTVTMSVDTTPPVPEHISCGLVHDPYKLRPVVVSTWQHTQLGACPDKSTIVPESQVLQESIQVPGTSVHLMYHSSETPGYESTIMIQMTPLTIPPTLTMVLLRVLVEGIVFEQKFEADPAIKFKFSWDRRNAYNQKVYGIVTATVAVGYKYMECSHIFWEQQTATMSGYDITSSEIGGWNLNIHHTYNFQEGILHKGDGTNIYLKERPRKAITVVGTGKKRHLDCRTCNGPTSNNRLMAPVALAGGRDGSLYIGDFNYIRRITPQRAEIQNVLKLNMPEVPYKYFMTVSPLNGRLYISDYQKKRIIRLKTMGPTRNIEQNQEPVAGTGDTCLPGDETQCGDNGEALKAKLLYPKGIAINKDGILFFADGPNIRMIDASGTIQTLIGFQGQPTHYTPLPCHKVVNTSQVMLSWPTSLAISPIDDTLHILDNNMVLKVTKENMVVVVAGRPLHCPPKEVQKYTLLDEATTAQMADQVILHAPQHIAFSSDGHLYIVESNHRRVNRVRLVNSDGRITHYMGGQPKCDCRDKDCKCFDSKEVLASSILLDSPTAITVTPDGVLHVSDMGNLRVYSILAALPEQSDTGNYQIIHAQNQEVYIFNRFGQHIHTKDIMTGTYVYNFTYNVNSFYGKLIEIRDHANNRLQVRRDYTTQANEIVPPIGHKCKLRLDNMGNLNSFTTGDGTVTKLTYMSGTGLLDAKEMSNGMAYMYDYDENGRLKTVTLPTGEVTQVQTDIDASGKSKKQVSFKDSGALVIEYPWKMAVTVETQPHPLLDFEHELKVKRKVILPDNLMHRLEWRYYLRREGKFRRSKVIAKIGRRLRVGSARFRHDGRHQSGIQATEHDLHDAASARTIGYNTKALTVNGENLLTIEYNRVTSTEIVLDYDLNQILQVVYNPRGQITNITPFRSQVGLNISYSDQHPALFTRGEYTLRHTHQPQTGFLTERKFSDRAKYRFLYKNGAKPSDVFLPSGKQYIFRYDNYGNLAEIMMPGLSKHLFRMLMSFNIQRIMYAPPETKGFYIHDFNGNGKLKHIWYPSTERRIYFHYNSYGRLKQVVHDWTDISFKYDDEMDVIVESTLHDRMAFDYKCTINTEPAGAIVKKTNITFSSNTKDLRLKPAVFSYNYDEHFRVIGFEGSIAGINIKSMNISYDGQTGKLSNLKSFMFKYPQLGKQVMRDNNMDITRDSDKYGRLHNVKYRVNNKDMFLMELQYTSLNRLHQWKMKIGSDEKVYQYDYDIDGNLLQAIENGKPNWQFKYDANSNIQEITFKDKRTVVEINVRNQVTSYKDKVYNYDQDGFLIGRNSEHFQFNSNGLLMSAYEPGKYDIRYFYDSERRLVARKDIYGGYLQQYFYANVKNKDQITHIFNQVGKQLLTLHYNEEGLLFAIESDAMYYVALDPMGSPLVIYDITGSVIKQMTYNPLGEQVTDSAPQFYFPFGYKMGLSDPRTQLIHMGSRWYDPTLGRWIAPDYGWFLRSVPKLTSLPELANLYQYMDIINPRNIHDKLFSKDVNSWLKHLGYNIPSLVPKVNFDENFRGNTELQMERESLMPSTSAFECAFRRDMANFESLSAMPESDINGGHDMDLMQWWKPLGFLFGPTVLISSQEQRVHVTILSSDTDAKTELATHLLNNSQVVDMEFILHGRDTHYFVHPEASAAEQIIRTLNIRDVEHRGGVDINVHRHGRRERAPEMVDIRLHGNHSVFNIRFGTTVEHERHRILRHAKERAVEAAWRLEKNMAQNNQEGLNSWTAKQKEKLLLYGRVENVTAYYIRDVGVYPQLADDPKNIKFSSGKR